jgi:NADH:ubiquinone oxidoreductase subunit 3 (subunit A)
VGLSREFYNRDPQFTSLESGFEILKHGLTQSSPFFILAVLFVIFDIELILIFPGILVSHSAPIKTFIYFGYIIVAIVVGLLFE